MMYLQCETCGHVIKTRANNPKRKRECNGIIDGKRCYGTDWAEVTRDDYDEYVDMVNPSATTDFEVGDVDLKAVPMAKPRISSDDVGEVERQMYEADKSTFNRELLDYKRMMIQERMAKMMGGGSGNGHDKEVEFLKEKVRQMEMQALESKFTAQLQELGNKFDKMVDVLNRPSDPLSPIQQMIAGWKMMSQSPFAGDGNSTDVQYLKNQGEFIGRHLDMMQMELAQLNRMLDKGMDTWQANLELKRQRESRENQPPGEHVSGRPPAPSEHDLDQALSKLKTQEQEEAEQRYLTRLMKEVKDEPLPDGAYWCGACSLSYGTPKFHKAGSIVHTEHFADRIVGDDGHGNDKENAA